MVCYMSVNLVGYSVGLIPIAFSIKEYMKGSLSNFELICIMISMPGLWLLFQIYMFLSEMNPNLSRLMNACIHSADKLSHIELRVINLTLTAHESSRQIVNHFFEWKSELDPLFFVRKVCQLCDLWSAAQHRQRLPCGLEQWQWVLQVALSKLSQDIKKKESEEDREYYNKSLEIFNAQRCMYPSCQLRTRSPNEPRVTYQESLSVTMNFMMSSLDD